jgi:hypothetical protein
VVEGGQGNSVFVVRQHLVHHAFPGRILVGQIALLLAIIQRERILRGEQVHALDH